MNRFKFIQIKVFLFFMILFFLLPALIQGQERAGRVTDFIPIRWEIYDQCMGDINGDGYPDAVLALQTKDSMPGIWETQYLKMLVIVFYDPAKNDYYVVEKSEEFLNPHSSNIHPDSFNQVRFDDDGNLLFDFDLVFNGSGYYRGYMNFTFRYCDGLFELIERNIETWLGGDKLSINYLLREAVLTTDSRKSNQNELLTQRGKVEINELPTLHSIGRPGRLIPHKIIWE